MHRDNITLIVSAVALLGSFFALREGYGIVALVMVGIYLVWFWRERRRR